MTEVDEDAISKTEDNDEISNLLNVNEIYEGIEKEVNENLKIRTEHEHKNEQNLPEMKIEIEPEQELSLRSEYSNSMSSIPSNSTIDRIQPKTPVIGKKERTGFAAAAASKNSKDHDSKSKKSNISSKSFDSMVHDLQVEEENDHKLLLSLPAKKPQSIASLVKISDPYLDNEISTLDIVLSEMMETTTLENEENEEEQGPKNTQEIEIEPIMITERGRKISSITLKSHKSSSHHGSNHQIARRRNSTSQSRSREPSNENILVSREQNLSNEPYGISVESKKSSSPPRKRGNSDVSPDRGNIKTYYAEPLYENAVLRKKNSSNKTSHKSNSPVREQILVKSKSNSNSKVNLQRNTSLNTQQRTMTPSQIGSHRTLISNTSTDPYPDYTPPSNWKTKTSVISDSWSGLIPPSQASIKKAKNEGHLPPMAPVQLPQPAPVKMKLPPGIDRPKRRAIIEPKLIISSDEDDQNDLDNSETSDFSETNPFSQSRTQSSADALAKLRSSFNNSKSSKSKSKSNTQNTESGTLTIGQVMHLKTPSREIIKTNLQITPVQSPKMNKRTQKTRTKSPSRDPRNLNSDYYRQNSPTSEQSSNINHSSSFQSSSINESYYYKNNQQQNYYQYKKQTNGEIQNTTVTPLIVRRQSKEGYYDEMKPIKLATGKHSKDSQQTNITVATVVEREKYVRKSVHSKSTNYYDTNFDENNRFDPLVDGDGGVTSPFGWSDMTSECL